MLPSSLRTALDLQKALSMAPYRLQPLGKCITRMDLFLERFAGLSEKDKEALEEEEPAWQDTSHFFWESPKVEQEKSHNRALVGQLGDIYKEHGSDAWNDTLEAPFYLTVTRPGCEFSGEVAPGSQEADKEAIVARLQRWYDHGEVSGFGDVRAQETRVDTDVRDAREIPGSEFTVSGGLIEEIKKHWAAHFLPGAVRVEPYKIHVYGPGGKFDVHRDTPEKDLVGTFLVGLGDTSDGGALIVGYDATYDPEGGVWALPATWVAFYPDVEHFVTTIKVGYRAVIAFKLFRTGEADAGEARLAAECAVVQQKMEDVLEKMHLPFGLLLEHKYCIGTEELSGLDNILHAAAGAVGNRRDAHVHFLPVLTKLAGRADVTDNSEDYQADAPVYPLTPAHIDALLTDIASETKSSRAYAEYSGDREYLNIRRNPYSYEWLHQKPKKVRIPIPGAEEWLANVRRVPFYSLDFTRSALLWKKEEEGGAEYIGNESKPWTEDSVYLSYAMIVLPNIMDAEEKGQK